MTGSRTCTARSCSALKLSGRLGRFSESLAGRVAVIQLLGLSRAELTQRNLLAPPFVPDPSQIDERLGASDALDLQTLYRIVWRGSMPDIALNAAMDRDLFYSSYRFPFYSSCRNVKRA